MREHVRGQLVVRGARGFGVCEAQIRKSPPRSAARIQPALWAITQQNETKWVATGPP